MVLADGYQHLLLQSDLVSCQQRSPDRASSHHSCDGRRELVANPFALCGQCLSGESPPSPSPPVTVPHICRSIAPRLPKESCRHYKILLTDARHPLAPFPSDSFSMLSNLLRLLHLGTKGNNHLSLQACQCYIDELSPIVRRPLESLFCSLRNIITSDTVWHLERAEDRSSET